MFWAPCSSGGGGWLGGAPHTCAHACTCGHAHTCVVNMIISCKWLLPLDFWGIQGNSLWYHMHMCMHVHVCRGHPLTTHYPHPPIPTPRGDPQNQSKFNSTWTNQDISIPFEDLKSVETSHPWVGVLLGGLGSGQNTKNFKNLDLIEIIQFCLKIYDL